MSQRRTERMLIEDRISNTSMNKSSATKDGKDLTRDAASTPPITTSSTSYGDKSPTLSSFRDHDGDNCPSIPTHTKCGKITYKTDKLCEDQNNKSSTNYSLPKVSKVSQVLKCASHSQKKRIFDLPS